MMIYAQIDENDICIATATSQKDSSQLPDNWILINNEFEALGKRYNNGIWEDGPEPEPEPLSETEQSILDTAINTEYLVCLADLGL